jgi:hypothetical protein
MAGNFGRKRKASKYMGGVSCQAISILISVAIKKIGGYCSEYEKFYVDNSEKSN